MANQRIPTVQFAANKNLSLEQQVDLPRQQTQAQLNRVIARTNDFELTRDLNARNHRITKMKPGTEGSDAVNLSQLMDAVAGLKTETKNVVIAGGGGGGGGANVTVYEITLTGDYTVVAPGVFSTGDIFIWDFTQDGTGGHSVTWPSTMKGGNNYPVSGAASIYNSFSWVALSTTNFHLLGQPIIGESIA